jgi:FkbH-like protein
MEFNTLKKNLKKDYSQLPVVKVALLADSASQLLAMALKGYGHSRGVHLDIWEADYDQVQQHVFDADSPLYALQPAWVVIFLSSEKMLSEFYKKDLAAKRQFATERLQLIEKMTDTLSGRLSCNIIFLNLAEINDGIFGNFANKTDASFLFQQRLINTGLMQLSAKKNNLNICDIAVLQNKTGRDNFFSDKFYITTDNVISVEALPSVAKSITDIVLSYAGDFRKCLVLDLDNTLWGGVIGDDGLEGIEIGDLGIGKAFTKFQQWISQLKERGIILAVCSKNDEQIAREPFMKHPDMVLHLDDFAIFVANWNNKVDNIRYIQSVLNIGFNSMVFLDDNPFEREMVKQEIPELTVPELPVDPAEYLSCLYGLNLFETASFTEEDTRRNSQYREEAARTELQLVYENEDEFLEGLAMTAVCKPVDLFTLPRAAQLTQRSNQFNLRTVRYSDEQMRAVTNDPDKFTLTVNLKDKFGDYGLISLVIMERKNVSELFIDTWIMSCRVLKRNVEQLVLNEIVTLAGEQGIKKIVGEYIATAKNGLVKEHYRKLGFVEENGYWVLTADKFYPAKTFITKQQFTG